MNVKTMNTLEQEVSVEDFEDNSDDGLLAIVDEVGIRLIQEEIQQSCMNYEQFKKESYEKRFQGMVPMMGGFATTIAAIPIAFSFDLYSLITASIVMTPCITGLFLGASGIRKDFKRVDELNAIVKNLAALRKNLLEQSLKIQVVSGEDRLGRNWSEVSGIKEDKAVKYLVRIVDDKETGFENIEAKEF